MLLIWEVETLAEYILQVKDLHFWYGEIHALKGISLNVEKTVLFLYLARMVPEKQQPYSIYPVSLRESTPVKSGIWGNVLTENLPIHYQRSALRSVLKVGASFPSFRYVKT